MTSISHCLLVHRNRAFKGKILGIIEPQYTGETETAAWQAIANLYALGTTGSSSIPLVLFRGRKVGERYNRKDRMTV